MRQARLFILSSLVCFTMQVNRIHAQTTVVSLNGVVMDSSGAVLPGSHIFLVNRGNSSVRSATSKKGGDFHFLALPPGDYRLRVSHSDFQASEIPELALHVNDQRELIIRLKPGNVHEVVTVTAAEISTDTAVSTTIDRVLVENMPLNGRTFQNLIELAPGTVSTVGGPGQFRVNGMRSTENYFTVDGVSANVGMSSSPNSNAGDASFSAYAGGSLPGFNAWGGTNSLLSVDALDEFKVDTATASAQFGRGTGAQVQLRSRSGTNRFHGSASEYLRNEILDANDWYFKHYINPTTGVWSPIARPEHRMNNFGATLGGPVLRNRVFFFFDYEGMRIKQPSLVNSSSIVARVRSQLSGLMLSIANALPLPVGPEAVGFATDPTDGKFKSLPLGYGAYSTTSSIVSNMNSYSGRIDWNPNSHWNVFGRVSDAPTNSGTQYATFLGKNTSNIQFLTAGFTYSHGSSFSNDFRLNLTQNRAQGFGTTVPGQGATPLEPSALIPSGYGLSNSSVVVRALGTAVAVGSTSNNLMRSANVTDTVYWSGRQHTIAIGDDYRYLLPRFSPANFALTYSFNTPANLIGFTTTAPYTANGSLILTGTTFSAGTISSLSYSAGAWVTTLQPSNAAFVTDTYRATERLTINAGLRWEVNPSPHGTSEKPLYTVQGWQIGSGDFSGLQLAPSGKPIYPTRWDGISPRIGVAYILHTSPTQSTVLRAAYTRNTGLGTSGAAASAGLFPYIRNGILTPTSGGYFTYPAPPSVLQPAQILSATGPYTNQQFNLFDPNYRVPYAHQETVSIQQKFGKDTSLLLAYVGTNGRAMLRRFVYTIPTGANPAFNGSTINVSANPDGNADTSDYNSFQVTLNRSLSRGLQFLTTLTWAHAIDTGSQDVPVSSTTLSTGNPLQLGTFSPSSLRGNSDGDQRLRFTSIATYQVPNLYLGNDFAERAVSRVLEHWGIAPTVTIQSSLPINIIYTRAISSTQSVLLRPNQIQSQPVWLSDPTQIKGKRLNPAAYSIPSTAVQGNALRNTARGFGNYTFDTSAYRDLRIHDGTHLRFRADVFNVFNHPSFQNPNGLLGSIQWNSATNTPNPYQPNVNFGTLGNIVNGLATAQASDNGLTALFQSSSPRSIQLSAKLQF